MKSIGNREIDVKSGNQKKSRKSKEIREINVKSGNQKEI